MTGVQTCALPIYRELLSRLLHFSPLGIEVAEDYDIVVCRGALYEVVQVAVKLVFLGWLSKKSWSINTVKCQRVVAVKWKAQ